jgi:hypothetical protein
MVGFFICASVLSTSRRWVPSHYARTKACVKFGGATGETPIQSGISIGITSFKMLGSKSNGGEGGINIHRLRFAINNGNFLL